MKAVEELSVCVIDYGTFIGVAEKLAETCDKVYYHSPIQKEYRCIRDAVIGRGFPNVTKIESFIDIDIIKEVDLFCFLDIGYGPEQKYLRSIGKNVWGSMGADELERLRTRFIKVIGDLGLPLVHSEKIKGLTALKDHLKTVKNKWIKVNEFREDMETWHHIDYAHSIPELARLDVTFGGASELVWFVVQDALDGATEIGYDGWTVDGWFPDSSFQGYEKKNELYLGAKTEYDKLPEELRLVNEQWSKVLKEYKYRNFMATEIRNFEGEPFFIDPTNRMPGQTGEQLLKTMKNLAEVVWKGSQGELIQPVWNADFAAEATLHHSGDKDGWRVVSCPDDAKENVFFYHGMKDGHLYKFPKSKNDEVGVVVGMAGSIEDTIEELKDNFDSIEDDSISIHTDGFKDLLEDIEKAQSEGIQFTDQPIPDPATALNIEK